MPATKTRRLINKACCFCRDNVQKGVNNGIVEKKNNTNAEISAMSIDMRFMPSFIAASNC